LNLILIITTVLGTGTLKSQVTPVVRSVSLNEIDRALIDQRLSKYSAFTIDKKELVNQLYAYEGTSQFQLRINENLTWTIDLELNDMRAPNYIATYTTDEGTFESKELFVVNTFKGTTSNGQVARFTIDENTFFGVIFGDNYHYVIRPAKDFTQNKEDNSFIVYHSWNIIPDDDFDYVHIVLEVTEIEQDEIVNSSNGSGNFTCGILLIATDADFEFHQARGGTSGSSDASARNHILSVLNIADGVYQSTFGLRFSVTFQHVYTTNAQPYTSTDPTALINSFRNHWNVNRTNVMRNVVHLFTGKNLTGGTLGVAWLGAINGNTPNNFAYAVTKHGTNMQYTTTHEIGHNLGANHPTTSGCCSPQRSVMCQGGNIANLWFCSQSISEISDFFNRNSSLLMPCVTVSGPLSLGTSTSCNTEYTYTINNLPATGITDWSWNTPTGLEKVPNSESQSTVKYRRIQSTINAPLSDDITIRYSFKYLGVPRSTFIFVNPGTSGFIFGVMDAATHMSAAEVHTNRSYYLVAQPAMLDCIWKITPPSIAGSQPVPPTLLSGWSTQGQPPLTFSPIGYHRIELLTKNGCGWTRSSEKYILATDQWIVDPPICKLCIHYSPNPVNGELTIEFEELLDTDEPVEYTVKLLDKLGNPSRQTRFRHRHRDGRPRPVKFNTYSLPPGTYYLHVEGGGELVREQIIVTR